ncbi:polysaccharide deacetylase family protein [Aminipila luticellarii]|nr:hypothetical protein [Aminipila luticellarii]
MKKVFLTVDVECHDIEHINRWITGKYKKEEYGLAKILEVAEKLQIPINFFVDVPEMNRYGKEYIDDIINKIKEYNQPVYLHLHPNYISGDETKSYFWQYDKKEQREIFKEVYSQYLNLMGMNKDDTLVFRMGRYGVDNTFYDILNEEKIKVIDLSYTYGNSKMCKLQDKEFPTNNIMCYKGHLLLPNTSYVGFHLGKFKKILGLDVAQTCKQELFDVIEHLDNKNIVITMHVWDLFKRYFFSNKIRPDHKNIDKLNDWIKELENMEYEFGKLEDLTFDDLLRQNNVDFLYDPYEQSIRKKVRFLWYNFIRFMHMARNSKKYFKLYLTGLVVLCIITGIIFKLIIL